LNKSHRCHVRKKQDNRLPVYMCNAHTTILAKELIIYCGCGTGEKELSDTDLPLKLITAKNAKFVMFCLRKDKE